MTGMWAFWFAAAAGCVAYVLATMRWLRVAQREHYSPGRVLRLSMTWAIVSPVNALLWIAAAIFSVASLWHPVLAVPAFLLLAVWPIHFKAIGGPSPTVFTPRVWRLLAVWVALGVILVGLGRVQGLLTVVLLAPVVMDLALVLSSPLERRLALPFVRKANDRLLKIAPTVVAITGSYGKTTTKNYVAHLISPERQVVITPSSFNNLLGISRSINDGLTPGTDVFVAEMGTHGPGEIRTMCKFFPPSISVITTIGEAHLDRMKSRSHIAQCKAEIAETAGTVVLNTDIPELRKLADLISDDKRLIECSTSSGDNMSGVAVLSNVQGVEVLIDGKVIYSGPVPGGVNPGNVACAIGAAVALGVSPQAIARQLPSLPAVDHRAVAARDARGVWIIDDTYNSNPSGASSALRTALNLRSPSSQVWVVTPGMFELGRNQRKRNRLFAEEVGSSPGTTLCIVGRTNRKALEDGARGVDGSFRVFRDRSAAIRALDESARPGDVILFENDLPDYYP